MGLFIIGFTLVAGFAYLFYWAWCQRCAPAEPDPRKIYFDEFG